MAINVRGSAVRKFKPREGNVVDLFSNAKVSPSKKKAKGKKVQVERIEVEGLEDYAAVAALSKIIETLMATFRETLDENAKPILIEAGCEMRKRPENLKIEEGQATGSYELRKRSSMSGLSDQEVRLCERYGIPTEMVQDMPETFIFNPDQIDWLQKNSRAVSRALKELGAPKNLILFQQATKKTVVAENSIDVLFRKPQRVVEKMIDVVAVFACKPQYTNIRAAFNLVRDAFKPRSMNDK